MRSYVSLAGSGDDRLEEIEEPLGCRGLNCLREGGDHRWQEEAKVYAGG